MQNIFRVSRSSWTLLQPPPKTFYPDIMSREEECRSIWSHREALTNLTYGRRLPIFPFKWTNWGFWENNSLESSESPLCFNTSQDVSRLMSQQVLKSFHSMNPLKRNPPKSTLPLFPQPVACLWRMKDIQQAGSSQRVDMDWKNKQNHSYRWFLPPHTILGDLVFVRAFLFFGRKGSRVFLFPRRKTYKRTPFVSMAAPAEPRGEKTLFCQILGREKLLKFVEKCQWNSFKRPERG